MANPPFEPWAAFDEISAVGMLEETFGGDSERSSNGWVSLGVSQAVSGRRPTGLYDSTGLYEELDEQLNRLTLSDSDTGRNLLGSGAHLDSEHWLHAAEAGPSSPGKIPTGSKDLTGTFQIPQGELFNWARVPPQLAVSKSTSGAANTEDKTLACPCMKLGLGMTDCPHRGYKHWRPLVRGQHFEKHIDSGHLSLADLDQIRGLRPSSQNGLPAQSSSQLKEVAKYFRRCIVTIAPELSQWESAINPFVGEPMVEGSHSAYGAFQAALDQFHSRRYLGLGSGSYHGPTTSSTVEYQTGGDLGTSHNPSLLPGRTPPSTSVDSGSQHQMTHLFETPTPIDLSYSSNNTLARTERALVPDPVGHLLNRDATLHVLERSFEAIESTMDDLQSVGELPELVSVLQYYLPQVQSRIGAVFIDREKAERRLATGTTGAPLSPLRDVNSRVVKRTTPSARSLQRHHRHRDRSREVNGATPSEPQGSSTTSQPSEGTSSGAILPFPIDDDRWTSGAPSPENNPMTPNALDYDGIVSDDCNNDLMFTPFLGPLWSTVLMPDDAQQHDP